MDDLARAIGAGARRERVRAGLTQDDVAEALGLDRAVIARIEAGTRPLKLDSELEALCDAIGTTVARLLLDATPDQKARFGYR